MKDLVRMTDAGLVVDRHVASRRYPLLGIVGATVYSFDGRVVWLAHTSTRRRNFFAPAEHAPEVRW